MNTWLKIIVATDIKYLNYLDFSILDYIKYLDFYMMLYFYDKKRNFG